MRETRAHQHTLGEPGKETETEIKGVDHSPSRMRQGVGEGQDEDRDGDGEEGKDGLMDGWRERKTEMDKRWIDR